MDNETLCITATQELSLSAAATGNSSYCLNDIHVLKGASFATSRLFEKAEKQSSNYFVKT